MSDERDYLPKEAEEPELESEDVEAHSLGGGQGGSGNLSGFGQNDEGNDDVEAHSLGGGQGGSGNLSGFGRNDEGKDEDDVEAHSLGGGQGGSGFLTSS